MTESSNPADQKQAPWPKELDVQIPSWLFPSGLASLSHGIANRICKDAFDRQATQARHGQSK